MIRLINQIICIIKEKLDIDSKNTVNAFLSSIPITIDNVGKELIKAQDSQEDFQSIVLDLMKDLDLMHEPEIKGEEESQDKDQVTENPQDSYDQQRETEQDTQEQIIESEAEGDVDEDFASDDD